MLTETIAWLVDTSRRYALAIIALAIIASCFLGNYVVSNIKINTDINQLLSAELDWRKREVALEKAFPQNVDRLVIVVDGATPDIAENAAASLFAEMGKRSDLFKNTTRPDNIPFFRKHGLLYLDSKELGETLDMLVQAQPLLGTIASDPSLRGLFGTLNLVMLGLQQGQFEYEKIDQPLAKLAETIEDVLAGQDRPLPWLSMMSGKTPTLRDLRKIILTQPALDYEALSPGEAASTTVRKIAQDLKLTSNNGVHVRLTGSVALNDEEFASVANGTMFATGLSLTLVLVILFLALRSVRLIVPILLTLTTGLIATTAFALAAVGSLNLISVAFAVMFVGIAVDFGIQFGVRYRDQRHTEADNSKAMLLTARIIALPLSLAAGSTALGFFTFIPTDYRGVAELGLIAGAGMIIAFILNLTLLPALLAVFRPPAEPESIGFSWAAPIDRFIINHRKKILTVTALLAIAGTVTATTLNFDFDPLNLKDQSTESVSTLFDLTRDPMASIYTIEILSPSLSEAQELAKQIEKLPEVSQVMTLASFVPEDQAQKISLVSDANMLLSPTLNPAEQLPAPTDDEIVDTLQKTITAINEAASDRPSAIRLSQALDGVVVRRDHALLQRVHDVLVRGMADQLNLVR
ncbi:MAG: MMPL family transporter, partial [Alphaproteobacteria bacterium]|nr:MMPL family transporter [Alphaproteobacteria bacterium]